MKSPDDDEHFSMLLNSEHYMVSPPSSYCNLSILIESVYGTKKADVMENSTELIFEKSSYGLNMGIIRFVDNILSVQY